ncbi:MAG: bifunctional (p)ppGpp synthetase/guanosine-3',5'-bis(diphosphate) 3'-pyrophosphohydrolase [Desulfobacteraceae bacterium]|nr:bifunctional (p)ppGpp synthetase/guanosine-3',5'-bis(diphosphate) 3'-pyrophosphohydrolase [Desulfobacteraceae bacterium]
MIRITDIIDKLTEYYPEADVDIIDRAYIYSARVHAGQIRLSGEPYLSHPLEVADILADMKLDSVSIAAGLLHDVVEDTHSSIEEIYNTFGNEVAHIVSGVTKISVLPFSTDQQRHAENVRKMILAMADDLRVILIKLADRLHNIRTLHYHNKPQKQRSIAQETLDIYAPIASRLGIYWLKNELEENSFYYANPEEYQRMQDLLETNREQREHYVSTVKTLIEEKMAEAGIAAEVQGRHKQYYSIYQKMMSQDLEFEEVYDIIAFRIIVENVAQCYAALGNIHSKWKPISKKIKDYIAVPKPNMYQSLHTTVIGPYGERMEIQIRTREMDHVAKFGIAAHWSYKEGKTRGITTENTFAWIHNLVENQKNFGNPEEFLENVRIDLFPDEVFVFTPQGEVKSLPKGATPVDFAYQIHTEVGNECTGAKVNGRLVSIQYELKTGDIVEILTAKGHQPSKDWLNFVKTVKAKSRIRQWIRKQEKTRSLSLGRELCEKAFRKHKLNFSSMLNTPEMEKVAESFNFKSVDDLIASVGLGKITPLQIIRKLYPQVSEKKETTLIDRLMRPKDRRRRDKTEGVSVHGMDDILIRFAKCCQPVPGDPITGYITHGQGVTVHRSGCINALKLNPDRQIDVEWKNDEKTQFPVSIKITGYDRIGLLAEVSTEISKAGANIHDVRIESRGNKYFYGEFTILVMDLAHLDAVMARLKKVSTVQEVKRV